MLRPAGLALLLVAGLAPAAGPEAEPLKAGSACGGNAYSSGQVIEGRPPRRGPITSVPDTLCADLDSPRPPVRIEIYGVPGLSGGTQESDGIGADGSGGVGQPTPYGGLPRRGAPTHRPRD
ncbi:hypothetical protein [Methylobacterium soli]|uniref:Porin n=1 Tax=Methylobacterium soli TaxID=553447 RepID=A0A6L3T7P7_9HYPH|nr:hypothetical protein [Methylobacterium soli]KAB1081418.1 hypothetical protein F6X53_03685 [Methylobacterium soli]GJE41471.1 hypothetical protein AEGHOMDF_0637 [Methylobacterium soli]